MDGGQAPVLLLALALVLALAVPAQAATPKWSQPRTVSASAYVGGLGIDDRGALTATWRDGNDPAIVLGSARPAGAADFDAPVELARTESVDQLAVNGDGRLFLLWADPPACRVTPCPEDPSCDGYNVCPETLRFRAGSGIRSLGPPQTLATDSFNMDMAMGEGGHVAVVWETGFIGHGLKVAVREPSGRVSVAEVLEPPDQRVTRASVAVDPAGNVLVAWGHGIPEARGFDTYAAYRPAGERFPEPERLWNVRAERESSSGQLAALDDDGDATVLFAARGLQVADRPKGGSFGRAKQAGPPGGPKALVSTAGGEQFAAWGGDGPRSRLYVGPRLPGGRFDTIPLTAAAATVGFDSRGNVLAGLLSGPDDGQALRVGTFTRFGFAPLELTSPLTTGAALPSDIAVNDAGAAALMLNEFPPGYNGRPGPPLRIVERSADRAAPALGLSARDAPGGRVALGVRCDEPCRVAGRFRLSARGTRGSARAAGRARPRRSVTLTTRARRRLVLRLTRAERRRVKRRLARRPSARVGVRVQAVDSFGNRSARTVRVAARRLLR